jgi:hypothetical protein
MAEEQNNNNGQAPEPEDMGERLDEKIRETVQTWADDLKNTDFEALGTQIEDKVRLTLAGWVGADEAANWKDIGSKMDANTRAAIGNWVGADETADWGTISNKIENRTRMNLAKMVKARRDEEGAEATWGDIGNKLESDVRIWVADLVGTKEDPRWSTIGSQVVSKVRGAVDKMMNPDKPAGDTPEHKAVKIEITTDDDDKPSTPQDRLSN